MKGVQCYELFGGIALKIHTFSFFSLAITCLLVKIGWVFEEENCLTQIDNM